MSVLDTLHKLLDDEIEKLIAQEDVVESLRRTIGLLEEASSGEVRKSPVGRLEEKPREVPPVNVSPRRLPEPPDSRPPCGACGGRLEPSQRTLQNGKVVNLLMCTDSGCNNEQYN